MFRKERIVEETAAFQTPQREATVGLHDWTMQTLSPSPQVPKEGAVSRRGCQLPSYLAALARWLLLPQISVTS